MNKQHIHTPENGRGTRKVYADGVEVQNITWANTETGEYHYYLTDEDGNWMVQGEYILEGVGYAKELKVEPI